MAKQPAKKTTTKKTVAKKAAEKTMKKTVATKKATAKKATAPVIETYSCGCSHSCQCGGKCHKGGFLKKLLFFVIVFALGFATAQMTCCNKRGGKMGPRPQFENGCLVTKCPKMAQFAQKMDTNQDGCISKDEFRTAKKQFKAELRAHKRAERPAPVVEPTVAE